MNGLAFRSLSTLGPCPLLKNTRIDELTHIPYKLKTSRKNIPKRQPANNTNIQSISNLIPDKTRQSPTSHDGIFLQNRPLRHLPKGLCAHLIEDNLVLPPLTKIARAIRDRRKTLKISQHKLARLVGCNQSYLCHIETGRRPVSLSMAKKLEVVLRAKNGSYRRTEFRRGRPPCSDPTRAALRAISEAHGVKPRSLLSHGVPRYPRPDRRFSLENPLWPIAPSLGAQSQIEVKSLEKMRFAENHFWRQFNSLSYQSWTEKRFQVTVGLTGAELLGVSSRRLGPLLPTANGKTGLDASRQAYPTFVLQQGDLSIAIIPQRCVGTSATYRWADSLVVAARGGRKVTAIIETDGADYHKDRMRDERRDNELDVPVLHIDAGEVGQPGLMERVFAWLRGLLPEPKRQSYSNEKVAS